ncbi:YvyF protein [Syntrophomonas wolfei]|uniref:YvyF n=1 Tax=Syntrophomonas wolfei subsp. wolfei (strain DSM 2245B / Goettingen) TaxID=335541 RepID=Q0AWU8_SYNWW|nr:YvyF protein [Syntrophomonas wolfei]ABI68806.1 YvyF [Syntrophomonas wolfei subsp. wolfei str. Goettingen G311]
MAEIRNCPKCKQLFTSNSKQVLCPVCAGLVEQEYSIVRNFIRDNPGVSLIDVVRETGVKQEIVLSFIREGRFVHM